MQLRVDVKIDSNSNTIHNTVLLLQNDSSSNSKELTLRDCGTVVTAYQSA